MSQASAEEYDHAMEIQWMSGKGSGFIGMIIGAHKRRLDKHRVETCDVGMTLALRLNTTTAHDSNLNWLTVNTVEWLHQGHHVL